MTEKKRSRRIPEKISNQVKARHFFECAWCDVPFFERHHFTDSIGCEQTNNFNTIQELANFLKDHPKVAAKVGYAPNKK
ncbi:hypothetical protein BH23BAC1_BH23BAC1_11510 [soil metagenome]